jgi:hypothetical protein
MPINIRESFSKDAIEEFDADVSGEEEAALTAVLEEVWQGDLDPSTLNIAVLAFVAGRAYAKASEENVPAEVSVKMRLEVMEKFIEFLVDGIR